MRTCSQGILGLGSGFSELTDGYLVSGLYDHRAAQPALPCSGVLVVLTALTGVLLVVEAWARSPAGGSTSAAVHRPGGAGGGGAARLGPWGVLAGAGTSLLVNSNSAFLLQSYVIQIVRDVLVTGKLLVL